MLQSKSMVWGMQRDPRLQLVGDVARVMGSRSKSGAVKGEVDSREEMTLEYRKQHLENLGQGL